MRRALSAGMAVMQQDATRALATVTAAGSFHQVWQRKTSANVASSSSSSSSSSPLRARWAGRGRRSVLSPACSIYNVSAFCFFAREISNAGPALGTSKHNAEAAATVSTAASDFGKTHENKENIPPQDNSQKNEVDGTTRHEHLKLDYAAAMLPHPAKASKGGEDAFFLEGSWMGVADGVGGWATEGVNSGLYSRELMAHCKSLVTGWSGKPDPKQVIMKAASSTKALGSATALVAALFEQTLYAANIGDAGFVVLRDGAVIQKSVPMQHEFNFPYQIGSSSDDPALSQTYEVPVRKGDIIVLATDGLFDNLFPDEIIQILSTISEGSDLQAAAKDLVKKAQQVGASSGVVTPFGQQALQLTGLRYSSGKLDDVTTVVALVT